ncbi:MAG: hypothetical protein JJT78_16415 [Leptospira sp.]|nr:hypothetical protein [Leptospira sp.]
MRLKTILFLTALSMLPFVLICKENKTSEPISTPESFIPDGWSATNHRVEFDWNRDGKKDIAMVLDRSDSEGIKYRAVLIVMSEGDDYKQSVFNENLIYNSDEGGAMGDPFSEFTEEHENLIIVHYGGSSWRWSMTRVFQYREGHFELVSTYDTYEHSATKEGSKALNRDLVNKLVAKTSFDENEKETHEELEDKSLKPILMNAFNIRKDLIAEL